MMIAKAVPNLVNSQTMDLLTVVFAFQNNKEEPLVHPQMIVTVVNIVNYLAMGLAAVFVLLYKEDPLV
jgi:hypothetical protein